MSEPSPSLAAINRMNQEQLKLRIESLEQESQHLLNKIERLKAMNNPPAEKIDALAIQVERLKALIVAAKDRLSGKQERSTQRAQGNFPGQQGGGQGGPGGGGYYGRSDRGGNYGGGGGGYNRGSSGGGYRGYNRGSGNDSGGGYRGNSGSSGGNSGGDGNSRY